MIISEALRVLQLVSYLSFATSRSLSTDQSPGIEDAKSDQAGNIKTPNNLVIGKGRIQNISYFEIEASEPLPLQNYNCTLFVDTESLEKARRVFLENFVSDDSNHLVFFLRIKTKPDLTIYQSTNERNSVEEWLWLFQKNSFFIRYPDDLDMITYDMVASTYKESEIIINIDGNDTCSNVKEVTERIEDLLWTELFRKTAKSYLCNRDFKHNVIHKEILYYISMVWVGYDLRCSFFHDDAKVYTLKEKGTMSISIICIIFALFYPLLFKAIEIRYIEEKLDSLHSTDSKGCSESETNLHNKILKRFSRNDFPFGYKRFILKLFYVIKVELPSVKLEGDAHQKARKLVLIRRNIAACRLSLILLILFSMTSMLRFSIFGKDVYQVYDSVYRVGLGVFAWIRPMYWTKLTLYAVSLCVGFSMLRIAVIVMPNLNKNEDGEHTRENNYFSSLYIEAFMNLISSTHWKQFCYPRKDEIQLLSESTSRESDQESLTSNTRIHTVAKCLRRALIPISIAIHFVLNICPFFWLIFKGSLAISKRLCKWDSYKRRLCFYSVQFSLTYVLVLFLMSFSQWVVLSSVISNLRSLFYVLFVALSTSEYFLRSFVVLATTLGYIGSFYKTFLDEYKNVLENIFSLKEFEKADYIEEKTFNVIIDKIFHIKQRVFLTIFKTIICIGFLIITTTVLIQNNRFAEGQSEYLIKLAFIVLSPQLAFTCFESRGDDIEEIMKNKESEIFLILNEKGDIHTNDKSNFKSCFQGLYTIGMCSFSCYQYRQRCRCDGENTPITLRRETLCCICPLVSTLSCFDCFGKSDESSCKFDEQESCKSDEKVCRKSYECKSDELCCGSRESHESLSYNSDISVSNSMDEPTNRNLTDSGNESDITCKINIELTQSILL